MPDPLTLTVPVDPRYRSLGSEAAGKYVELVGGTPDDGVAVAAAVSTALDAIAAECDAGAHVDLALRGQPAGIEVTMACGSQTRVVTHSFAAA
jgi:hypothetical protein